MKKPKKKPKKSAQAAIAASLLSAGMFISAEKAGAFDPADIEVLPRGEDRAVKSEALYSGHRETMIIEDERHRTERLRKEKLARIKAGSFSAMSFSVLLVIKVILNSVMKTLGKIAAPLAVFALGVVIRFAFIAVLCAVFFKLIYPEKSLRELFTLKNVITMAVSAIVMNVAETIAGMMSARLFYIGEAVRFILTAGASAYAWYRIFGRETGFSSAIRKLFGAKASRISLVFMAFIELVGAASRILFHFAGTPLMILNSVTACLITASLFFAAYYAVKKKTEIISI